VSGDGALKLTVLFGERARADGGFLADALVGIFARHRLRTSLVLRGIEGFGAKHQLRTDRLLTLSEDLPLVSVAVDARPRIEAVAREIASLRFSGLVTLERARMLSGRIGAVQLPADLHEATKLTVYVGRQERTGHGSAHRAVVDLLHARGIAGATVLLGVDGTVRGVRERAGFFSRNAEVPLMIIAVGSGEQIAATLPDLGALLARPLMTLERVRLCKRDGELLARPREHAAADASGLGVWQKLMVYAGEQSRHRGRPLAAQLMQRLREAGAPGATSLRGIWGYHGAHDPHGDTLRQLRRRVPVITVVIDSPERIGDWFAIVDELTDEAGLVTSELVPAFHATSAQVVRGGLRLALPDAG
jgi:PII-like signaling protein